MVSVGVLARELGTPPESSQRPADQDRSGDQQEGSGPPPGPSYPEGKEFGFVVPEEQLDQMPQIAEEVLGGRMPDRFTYYKAWAQVPDFDPTVPDKIIGHGMQPLLTWEPMNALREPNRAEDPVYQLQTIIDGEHDDYIRRWAQQIKDWGRPLWIRWGHEMNLDIYPWCGGCNGNTPEQYVQAYRHVVDVFREEGVTNVKWNWSVNIVSDTTVPIDQLYPGDDYVDEVGIDGYNGGTEQDWGGWTMFGDLFGPTLEQVEQIAPDKPVHITETGSSMQGGDRAAWIRDLFQQVKGNPNIKGFTYFNLSKEGGGEANWKLEAQPESIQAFREELQQLNG